jgi:hypothetical protein
MGTTRHSARFPDPTAVLWWLGAEIQPTIVTCSQQKPGWRGRLPMAALPRCRPQPGCSPMHFRSLAILGLIVLSCGVCGGCHYEYKVTAKCTDCNSFISSEYHCSEEAAVEELSDLCQGTLSNFTVEEDLELGLGCVEPPRGLAKALRNVSQQARLLVGMTREPQAVGGPTCPPQTVDLKVTVYYDVGHAFCPNSPKEFEVRYNKLGQQETVKLLQDVPAGTSYEFICTDAAVTNGQVEFIGVLAENGCSCTDLYNCAQIGTNVYDIPADGSSVEIHANFNTFTLTPTIIPPPDEEAAAPANAVTATPPTAPARRKIVPIADPTLNPPR